MYHCKTLVLSAMIDIDGSVGHRGDKNRGIYDY